MKNDPAKIKVLNSIKKRSRRSYRKSKIIIKYLGYTEPTENEIYKSDKEDDEEDEDLYK